MRSGFNAVPGSGSRRAKRPTKIEKVNKVVVGAAEMIHL
jgi:hypothetical protein